MSADQLTLHQSLGQNQDQDHDWEQVYDEDSQHYYWYNTSSHEVSWGEEKEVADPFAFFTVPPVVLKKWTDHGVSILFHGNANPSPFIKISVYESSTLPYRQCFKLDESEIEGFVPKLFFYAFANEMPNTQFYSFSYAMNPYRTRVLPPKAAIQTRRDITKWNTSEEEAGFWAHPIMVPGSDSLHVDWTSGPDRYKITTDLNAEWGWSRCFSFFAYTAAKYHVMECLEPLCYKIVEGPIVGETVGLDDDGYQWNCLMAFYAFQTQVPGTNKYHIQYQDSPHPRVRIGMEPARTRGWLDHSTFFAFDMAVPNTCKLNVQYTIQSTERDVVSCEQFRIYTKEPWGVWEDKFAFYAFPASSVVV